MSLRDIIERILPDPKSKEEVDESILDSQYPSKYPCYICNRPASLQIIAKHDHNATAQLDKEGFICNQCIKDSPLSADEYGIRPIKPDSYDLGV